jgi:hypothetical protein
MCCYAHRSRQRIGTSDILLSFKLQKKKSIVFTCLRGLKIKGILDTPSDLHIMSQVNDYPISRDHQERTSQRMPDVAILPFKCAFAALPEEERDDDNSINAATKPETRLVWKDMLACIEFKRPTKKLSKSPLSYEVTPYKSTNPEYRCVEHTVSDAPATAAAAVPDSECKWRIRNPEVKLNQLSYTPLGPSCCRLSKCIQQPRWQAQGHRNLAIPREVRQD